MDMALWIGVVSVMGLGCAQSVPGLDPALADGGALDGSAAEADVRVAEAWWREPGDLRVVVELRPTSRAVRGGPSSFVLHSRTGVLVPAVDAGLGTCVDGTDVHPGELERCTLRFRFDGEPAGLAHDGGFAPLHACGPSHPFGLCEPGAGCAGGRCRRLCGRTEWDGLCVNEDEVCDRGECVSPCSDTPGSGCEEGACIGGRCVEACGAIAWPDDSCFTCAWDVLDGGTCALSEERCRGCADCPGTGLPLTRPRTRCECLGEAACDGCEDASRAYWDCLTARCPSCAE